MSLDVSGILDQLVSHAMTLGIFERVNTVEPKSAPGNGLTAAVWAQRIEPVKSSGLASTSVRLEFTLRIYSSMLAQPQDMIDPNILNAVGLLMSQYSGDFTLGDRVRKVDLLGEFGVGLMAQAGYLDLSGTLMRVMDITLPLIVNDVWDQVA